MSDFLTARLPKPERKTVKFAQARKTFLHEHKILNSLSKAYT